MQCEALADSSRMSRCIVIVSRCVSVLRLLVPRRRISPAQQRSLRCWLGRDFQRPVVQWRPCVRTWHRCRSRFWSCSCSPSSSRYHGPLRNIILSDPVDIVVIRLFRHLRLEADSRPPRLRHRLDAGQPPTGRLTSLGQPLPGSAAPFPLPPSQSTVPCCQQKASITRRLHSSRLE